MHVFTVFYKSEKNMFLGFNVFNIYEPSQDPCYVMEPLHKYHT